MTARFDEWPLACFTALGIGGAGIVAARQVPAVAGLVAGSDARWHLLAGGVLVGVGLLLSLLHLGRPFRAPRAMAGATHSALSQEVLLGLATAALSLGAAVPSPAAPLLAPLAGIFAALFLGALGLVYRLPGQNGWSGAASATAFTAGLATGALVLAAQIPTVPLRLFAFAFVFADLATFTLRWLTTARRVPGADACYPAVFARRHVLLATRVAYLDLLPVFLLLVGHPVAAIVTLAAGLFIDRIAFYAVATRRSIEAEVARVEAIIGE